MGAVSVSEVSTEVVSFALRSGLRCYEAAVVYIWIGGVTGIT